MITEIQPEIVAITAAVTGTLPLTARSTVDGWHNPAYAAGYLYNAVKPRLAMATHVSYDGYALPETIAEVREHWKGPFQFGAPDMVVVNLTKDKVWVREGVVPKFPNMASPKFDVSAAGGLLIPVPTLTRREIQSQEIRDAEISPALYYPEGYNPQLMPWWPSDKPIFIPEKSLPEKMKKQKPQNPE